MMAPRVPDRPSELGIQKTDGQDSWWPTQQQTIQQIVDAYEDKRFVLANVPTGGGKTIIATAVQRLLDVSSVNLTHSIYLQRQYAETMPWAAIVTGRRNHSCDLATELIGVDGMTADKAPCTQGDDCVYMGPEGCSYYRMLYDAADCRQVVTNYAYAVRIFRSPRLKGLGKNPFHRPFLVCDEAHLAEDAVVEATRTVFTRKTWRPLSAPFGSLVVLDWMGWA